MKHALIFLALATIEIHAQATGVSPAVERPVVSSSDSSATSKSGSSAVSGSLYGGESSYYAIGFPQPSRAAPLPPGLCPKGDSLSWSVGWGLFSYSVSSTRTELECLERAVKLMREDRQRPAVLPPVEAIHPTCAVPSTPTKTNLVRRPARKCR